MYRRLFVRLLDACGKKVAGGEVALHVAMGSDAGGALPAGGRTHQRTAGPSPRRARRTDSCMTR